MPISAHQHSHPQHHYSSLTIVLEKMGAGIGGKGSWDKWKRLREAGTVWFQPSLFLSWGCCPILNSCPRLHLHWSHLSLSLPKGPLINRMKSKSHSVPWRLSVIVPYPWQLISVPQSLRNPPSHHSGSKGSTADLELLPFESHPPASDKSLPPWSLHAHHQRENPLLCTHYLSCCAIIIKLPSWGVSFLKTGPGHCFISSAYSRAQPTASAQ